ncbi:hypothetical protein TSAR_011134 [Trichomalopsis sarcophagae]|uniref:Tudor domain-containing protein n=1 Tax=Trichomalopsis sarcophagae TaxID=543379 RepID=A0A232FGQ1_9HYME|nr:hypothetical protein TSAR_011134 [Trichomalopsis sarcophagae]
MTNMEAEWKNWASIIRSCIITSKTPLTPFEINRDVKMLEGKDVPYRAFNYQNLEAMLRKVPGLQVFQMNGKTVAKVLPTENTAHIANMVRLQKSSKKKRTIVNRFNAGRRTYPNTRPQQTSNNRTNVPNRPSIQNRINTSNNSYSRSFSTEPQRRTTPSPTAHSTPTRSNSYDAASRTPTPLMQTPITPPPTPLMQKLVTPPMTSSHQKSQQSKTVSFSSIQSRLSPPPLMQQKVQMPQVPAPKPNLAQRLNAAQQRPIPVPSVDDPRLRLLSYTEARNLPHPVYIDVSVKNDKNIYSAVMVCGKKHSSYPQEAKTKDEAEKLAAKNALSVLMQNTTPQITTEDRSLILKRVLEIIGDHPNGMFESCVVETYVEKYVEALPKNWLKIVDQAVMIDVGANNQAILSPLSRSANGKRSTSPRAHSPLLNQEPDVLQLKDMDEFWLHVYVVYGTTDIWGVIIDEDHSDKIDELAQEMKTWYDVHNSPVPTIVPGKYYAVLDSEYHRVRCIKVDPESQQATVFFIDRGDEDVFPVTRLRSLQSEFCVLPAQSVRLSLTGLEDFGVCEEIQALLEEMLVDKTVLVKNMKFEPMYNEERYVNPVSAQLEFEEEESVNDKVKQEIMRILDPNTKIGVENTAQQGFISHVSDKAIFVQLKSTGLELFNNLMDRLTIDCLNKSHFKLKPVSRFDPTKIYLTENPEDKKWYRAKITRIINENEAQVMCIDVGNAIQVKKDKLVLLEELSDLLTLYPKQAVQVQLHKISQIDFDKKMAQHLRKLAPRSDLFYFKVVGMYEQVPIVEFYKRTENNYLASLNDTLALEPEIQSKDDEYNNNTKPRIRNIRSSIGTRSEFPLKAPSIPSVNSFFDVHITMAAHPGNFTIQPLLSVPELEKLMVELSNVCNSYNGPPLTPDAVKVGNMYAAKYDDGRWYRAYVSKVISKNVCAVYFCDYGITPKLKGDWSVKDTLRFNELIVSKKLVSIIKSCDMDNLQSGDTVLSLELIDTTTSEDIYITNVLVNENRADRVDKDNV